MSYSLTFTAHARRQIGRLDDAVKQRIKAALNRLAGDPFASGASDVKKLRGRTAAYRLRVGNYRVVYEIVSSELRITVIEVDHRRNVYR